MTNCIVPTFADAPELETVIVECPYPFGPSGAKGVGEIPMDGPAAAVANDVEHALGVAQCGSGTPGIAVCAAYVVDRKLLHGDEATARAQVRELLAGNICRCTGYQLIVDAVMAAAAEVAK